MFGTHNLWRFVLFVLSGLLLNIAPGPDTLYIVGRSSTPGFRAGAVAALGIGAGTLLLGAIFDINGTIWNLLVAWSTARLSSRLAPSAAFKRWFNRCVGGVFVLIGIRLALADERL